MFVDQHEVKHNNRPKVESKNIWYNESINDDESHMSACTTHMPTDSSGLTGPIRKLTGKPVTL